MRFLIKTNSAKLVPNHKLRARLCSYFLFMSVISMFYYFTLPSTVYQVKRFDYHTTMMNVKQNVPTASSVSNKILLNHEKNMILNDEFHPKINLIPKAKEKLISVKSTNEVFLSTTKPSTAVLKDQLSTPAQEEDKLKGRPNNAPSVVEGLNSSATQYPPIQYDTKRVHWKTWWTPSECSNYLVHFAKPKTLGLCALTSYPGSGNTWLRYLLEAATGVFTGSTYQDGQLRMWGYLGETENWASGTTIVQKSHEHSNATIESFNKKSILLVRNPYRAILAFHNFIFGSHRMYAPIVNYRRKDWPTFVHIQLRSWLNLIKYWVTSDGNILIIHYENLQKDPIRELRKALNFLKVPADENRFKCLKHSLNTVSVKRHNEHFPDHLEIFPNVTRDKIDRSIRYTAYLFEKFGYETPPLDQYEFYNGTSSDKMIFVPCEKFETTFDCDQRIDNLNLEASVHSRRQNEEKNTQSNSNSTNFKETFSEMVENSALKLMSNMLRHVTKNPLDIILNHASEAENYYKQKNKTDSTL